ELLESEKASALAASVSSLEVLKVERRRARRQPPVPFITSTLQQEASRKLRLGVAQTMRSAQALYEAGYITYMRTDRPILSKAAAGAAEQAVRDSFGEGYLRIGEAKVAKVKGSQEAHEAIRPALIATATPTPDREQEEDREGGEGGGGGEKEGGGGGGGGAGAFLHPSDLPMEGLEPQERALYELVYRRTLASTMAESEADFTTVSLGAEGVSLEGQEDIEVVFKATGKTTVFDGFLKAYTEGTDEAAQGGGEGDEEAELPRLEQGDGALCQEARPMPHRTSPPRRF
ncbi:unnamed protein product, partial [Laminaria digitata]